MNLIYDSWICARKNESFIFISPSEITEALKSSNPITDVITDRPDFKGALYQFLIGLLQTIMTPKTDKEWFSLWKAPPPPDELKARFASMAHAFEFDSEGPAFMQDFDLPEGESKPIAALLIESPGGKTLRDNLDHFIKRGRVEGVCHACAALALFTMQTNAPSGGVGHRVGLRGGGPLTTLIDLDETTSGTNAGMQTLWHKLWLNVVPEDALLSKVDNQRMDSVDLKKIFPWLGPTPTSEKKTGKDTFLSDVHPYQMFWGMPRRIRIDFKDLTKGRCDVCGTEDTPLIRHFITKNYGINYSGIWEHPLTPYSRKKQTDEPLPLHGQKGGITYRNWLGLTLGDRDNSQFPARTIAHFFDKRIRRLKMDRNPRIWAFGYDMDNMKARCWYDSRMPLYDMDPSIRETIKDIVAKIIDAAVEMNANLRKEIRNARYKRPQDVKGDWSFVDNAFWQSTEGTFYDCLQESISALNKGENTKDAMTKVHRLFKRTAMALFDEYSLGGPFGDMDMRRVVSARRKLSIWLETGKKTKELLGKA